MLAKLGALQLGLSGVAGESRQVIHQPSCLPEWFQQVDTWGPGVGGDRDGDDFKILHEPHPQRVIYVLPTKPKPGFLPASSSNESLGGLHNFSLPGLQGSLWLVIGPAD